MLALNKDKYLFIAYLIGAFVLSFIPVLHWPFAWLETFFHEISHGLAALATGGSINKIEIYFNGAGRCYTTGGWNGLISFSGYLGASLWGAAIYIFANSSRENNKWVAIVMAGFVVLCGLLWARNGITIIILSIISLSLYLSFRYVIGNIFPRFMEFVGIYVMVNAFRSPLHLVDGRHYGDGAALSDLTYLPELFWVGVWWACAAGLIYFIWYLHNMQLNEPASG